AIDTGQGGGVIGFTISAALTAAVGNAGAWVVLGLLLVVGLLLYFNMTIGDLVAAYLAERDERRAREAAEAARRAGSRRPRPAEAGAAAGMTGAAVAEPKPGLIDRVRERLGGSSDIDDEPPLI